MEIHPKQYLSYICGFSRAKANETSLSQFMFTLSSDKDKKLSLSLSLSFSVNEPYKHIEVCVMIDLINNIT